MPPRPPHKPNWSTISAVVAGVIAVVAVTALIVTLVARATSSPGDVALEAPSTSSPAPPAPGYGAPDTGTADEPTSPSDAYAVRDAMQRFVDAMNSRDVARIRESVCSPLRQRAAAPDPQDGNLVLEGLRDIVVTGDVAQSGVVTHIELGNQRSQSRQVQESFRRENGTWYVCPGTEPDIGA